MKLGKGLTAKRKRGLISGASVHYLFTIVLVTGHGVVFAPHVIRWTESKTLAYGARIPAE